MKDAKLLKLALEALGYQVNVTGKGTLIKAVSEKNTIYFTRPLIALDFGSNGPLRLLHEISEEYEKIKRRRAQRRERF